ncbi:iron-containing alcohol dehydrogenase family protein [Piscibacillus halophilus]|uniref:iron-containing alcohol dehydrogenase family protein n=1 Tax=Piscibacillus halophilus TaxID=571933 RepID=UPI00158D9E11|nr:iron-containing alcohol dehydrogenase family protein [Piscibacillus halophilus]
MNLNEFTFFNPNRISYGVKKLDQTITKEIKRTKKSHAFLATDSGLVQTGMVDRISKLLKDQGVAVHVFSDVEPNPHAGTVMRGVSEYKEHGCDFLLAVGGGSPMDFAKAVGVAVSHEGSVLDYVYGREPIVHKLPLLICVPTTVGTGSEVTSVAVITDEQQERKYVLASPFLTPNLAIVDPTLTLTLPRHVVAATGMDAFVHAIESYTSTLANPITDGIALQAIKMLKEHLLPSYAHPSNMESRSQIHLASTMAGIAFNTAGLGVVHACSHPMSAVFQVPHGLANAIILPKAIEYNLISNYKKYADIARILDSSLNAVSDEQAANALFDLLEKFNEQLDIPTDFSYIEGVEPEHLEVLTHDALHDQLTIPMNPRKVEKTDIEKIYKTLIPQFNKELANY